MIQHLSNMQPSLVWVLLILLMGLVSCTHAVKDTSPSNTPYESVWLKLYPNTKSGTKGSIRLNENFNNCATSTELHEAENCWTGFLEHWAPSHVEFEDGMHASFVEWARYELERVTHIMKKNYDAKVTIENKLYYLADHH